MGGFLLGAVAGAAAMWIWGDTIRTRFADRIDGVVDQVLGVLDGVEDRLDGLRTRVDAMASGSAGTGERRERRTVRTASGSA
jgi:hypothetical protein